MTKIADLTVGLTLDTKQLSREIGAAVAEAQAAANRKAVRLDVEAETAKAQREIYAIASKNWRTQIQVQLAGEAAARGKLSTLVRPETKRVRVDLDGTATTSTFKAASGVILLAGSLGSALVPAAAAAGAGLLALGGALSVAGAAAGTAALAFGGIGAALKAMSDADLKGAREAVGLANSRSAAEEALASARRAAARSAVSSARAVSDAARAVSRAEEAAAEAVRDAADAVKDAKAELADTVSRGADAVSDALDRQIDAEIRLRDAQTDAEDAQRDLNEARKDAEQDLVDYRLRLRGLALDEKQQIAEVAKARKNLETAQAFGAADSITERLSLTYDEEVLRLEELRRQQEKTTAEISKGVEGSDRVVSAREREAEATESVARAQRDAESAAREVAETRSSTASDVMRAENRLATAQDEYAKARLEAVRSIEDAERDLRRAREDASASAVESSVAVKSAEDALEQSSSELTSTQQALADSLKGLSPASREFAEFLYGLKPKIDELRATAAAGLFPGVEAGIRALVPLFDDLNETVGVVATSMGEAFEKIATWTTESGAGARFLKLVQDLSPALLDALARSIIALSDAFITIGEKSSDITISLADGMADLLESFAEWTKSASFDRFLEIVRADLPVVLDAFSGMGRGILALMGAVRGPGLLILGWLGDFGDWLADIDPAILEKVVVGILGAAAAMGAINAVSAGMTAAATAWASISRAVGLLVSPAGLAVAAIAAIGFAIYDITFNDGKNLQGLVDKISSGIEWLRTEGWPKFRDAFVSIADKALTWWGGEGGDKFREGVITAMDKAAQWLLVDAPPKIAAWLKNIGVSIYKWWTDDSPDGGSSNFRKGIKDAWNRLIEWLESDLARYAAEFGGWLGGVLFDAWEWVWDNRQEIARKSLEVIGNLLAAVFTLSVTQAKVAGAFFVGLINAGWTSFQQRIGEIGWSEALKDAGRAAMGGFAGAFEAGIGNMVSSINTVIDWLNRGIAKIEEFADKLKLNISIPRIPKLPVPGSRADGDGSDRGQRGAEGGVGGEVTDFVRGVAGDIGKFLSDPLGVLKSMFASDDDGVISKLGVGAFGTLLPALAKKLAALVNPFDGDSPAQKSGESFSAGNLTFPLPRGAYRVGRGSAAHGYPSVDFPAPGGTPIFAPFSGVVERQLHTRNGSFISYGREVRVRGAGMTFRGAHLSAYGKAGKVSAGDIIGYVGSTGNSTGNHLHAEFLRGGARIDPSSVLKYDTGGILRHGMSAINLSNKPEAILTNAQWKTLERVATAAAGGEASVVRGDARGPVLVVENYNVNGATDPDLLLNRVEFLVSAGRIR